MYFGFAAEKSGPTDSNEFVIVRLKFVKSIGRLDRAVVNHTTGETKKGENVFSIRISYTDSSNELYNFRSKKERDEAYTRLTKEFTRYMEGVD